MRRLQTIAVMSFLFFGICAFKPAGPDRPTSRGLSDSGQPQEKKQPERRTEEPAQQEIKTEVQTLPEPLRRLGVSSFSDTNDSQVLLVEQNGPGFALLARAAVSTAVFGIAQATTGANFGVRGESASSNGSGVQGEATAGTGPTIGVLGRVSSPNGSAGVFHNSAKGNILLGAVGPRAAPKTVFQVNSGGDVVTTDGDFQALAAGRGLILKSPDGSLCRRLAIDNAGNLALTSVACP